MLIVLPLLEMLKAPVADRLEVPGADTTIELLEKPTLAPPRPLSQTLLAPNVPVEVRVVLPAAEKDRLWFAAQLIEMLFPYWLRVILLPP